jgi:hypothetical protein
MLSLSCGKGNPPLFSGSPLAALAQLAELFLIKRVRDADRLYDCMPVFDRHGIGTMIAITSES